MPHILLATYNGAAYLSELLNSIRSQSFRDWRLLVRDDGSTDATRQILAAAAAADSRIVLLDDTHGRSGAAQNFGSLMRAAVDDHARYAFFADQDDVWLPEKLSLQMAEMQQFEEVAGSDTPLLVHSDLTVVDAKLRPIATSYRRLARVHHDVDDPLGSLLVANHVTGCATMLNRALLQAASPLPSRALIHDWWTALVAAAVGRLRYLPEPTLLYRQHDNNTIGVAGMWRKLNPLDGQLPKRWRRTVRDFSQTIEQMHALHERLLELTRDQRHPAVERVGEYCSAFKEPASVWRRWNRLRRIGYGRAGVFRQATLAARLWALRGKSSVA